MHVESAAIHAAQTRKAGTLDEGKQGEGKSDKCPGKRLRRVVQCEYVCGQ